MANNASNSTCLASSILDSELPSKFSSGSFRILLSNTYKNAISETDLAYDFKMPKQKSSPVSLTPPSELNSAFSFPALDLDMPSTSCVDLTRVYRLPPAILQRPTPRPAPPPRPPKGRTDQEWHSFWASFSCLKGKRI